jgi:fructose/tagatose bisphosphate aldolase
MSNKIFDEVKPGVVTGDDIQKVFAIAKKNEYAIPAVNVVGTNSVNAVIEAAKVVNSPVIVQFSNGGAVFFAGKGLSNEDQKAAIAGAVSGARHVHAMADAYGVPVILHTDHAAKNCCHGSTVFWMLAKSISKSMASHCSVLICSICQKSPWKRTLPLVPNTLSA